jgi:hypothetical protein
MSDEKGNLLDSTKKEIPELTKQARKELEKQIADSE